MNATVRHALTLLVIVGATIASFALWPFTRARPIVKQLEIAGRQRDPLARLATYRRLRTEPRANAPERFAAGAAAAKLAREVLGARESLPDWQAIQFPAPSPEQDRGLRLEWADTLILAGQAGAAIRLLNELDDSTKCGQPLPVRDRLLAAHVALGENQLAIACYRELAELPDLPAARRFDYGVQWAQTLLKVEAFGEAERVLARLVPADDEQRDALTWTRGEWARAAKKSELAATIFAEIAADAAADRARRAEAFLRLAELDLDAGREDNFLAALRDAVALGASPLTVARLLCRWAEHAEAAVAEHALAEWVEPLHGDPEAQALVCKTLGQLAWRRQDKQTARGWFARALALTKDQTERAWLQETLREIDTH